MASSESSRRPDIPDSLTFSQKQVNEILGWSLATLYRETLKEPLPDQLKALIDQLERMEPN
jgi:hypothetical protein